MPELPEVEFGRRLADRVAKGRAIEGAWTADDDIVLEDGPDRTREALEGRRVRAVRRRGKQLWFELDDRPWPLFHFGMTGAFRAPDEPALELASSPKAESADWPPRFCKVRLQLDDGGELAFVNKRRLGRVRLRDEPESAAPVAELGWDPLEDTLRSEDVAARFARRKGAIKGALLGQTLFAGVGNWIADEVLYQAGLDPRRPAAELSRAEVSRLVERLRDVVKYAVDVDADKARFPGTWLFHHRWGNGRAGEPRTSDGDPITFIKVAGRSTAWVPTRQK